MAESPINVDRQWFNLHADPDRIDSAAKAWTALGKVGDDAATDLNKAAAAVYDDPWEGDTKDSYEEHQKKLRNTSADMVDAAKPIVTALGKISSALRERQKELNTLENKIVGKVACTTTNQLHTFKPKDAKETKWVMTAVGEAKTIRSNLDTELSTEGSNLQSAMQAWSDMSTDWQGFANGTQSIPNLPAESTTPRTITLPNGKVVYNTGPGDDNVNVSTKPDGTVVVTVNGKTTEYPPGTDIVLRTGGGNDKVSVDQFANTGVTMITGDGNDSVNAGKGPFGFGNTNSHNVISGSGNDSITLGDGDSRVSTGGGDDKVNLGDGNNRVATGDGTDSVKKNGLFFGSTSGDNDISTGRGDDSVDSGTGNDRIYSGEGNDNIKAGDGNDTVDAGSGNDTIDGSYGNDNLYGGDGDDKIAGGDGHDNLYGNYGDDELTAGSGNDNVYGGSGEDMAYGNDGNDFIDTAGGDDQVYGGKGDDTVYAGAGDDYLDGQDGNDHINGQDGGDTIYGLDGDDTILGEDGKDYLEGAEGNDTVDGGAGEDVVSGGRGDDTLSGGDDKDVIYAGDGKDNVDGGGGNDTAYIQDGQDTVSGNTEKAQNVKIVAIDDEIDVEGSDEFKDRINADLNMLAGSPNGSQMLSKLDGELNGLDEITIKEFDEQNGTASTGDSSWYNTEATVQINPDYRGSGDKPPVSVLYHELAHSLDYLDGTLADGNHTDPNDPDSMIDDNGNRVGVPNDEREAAGLPIDHDGDPSTPTRIDPDHPYEYTENGLREEMNWGHRDHYGEPIKP